jgi:Trk K+ transport system NAD-binding subunit
MDNCTEQFDSLPGGQSLGGNQLTADQFLVCGLGSLGQHCVRELVAFGVRVSAIDLQMIQDREVAGMSSLLDKLYHGDCRDEELLREVGLDRYRAILIVTSQDRVNIEAAMTARMLNPKIRVVMRSSKEVLNALLTNEIENFVSFEPSALAAPSFAMAALSGDCLAQLRLKGKHIQFSRHHVGTESRGQQTINQFIRPDTVVLCVGHHPIGSQGFYQYQPEQCLKEGDVVVTLSVLRDTEVSLQRQMAQKKAERERPDRKSSAVSKGRLSSSELWKFWQDKVDWIQEDQIRRVAFICSTVIFLLLMLGGYLFFSSTPDTTLTDSLYATVVLILGGYSDLLGGDLNFDMPVPWWLRFFALLLTISGTLFVGMVYAVFTQYLLSMRFNFKRDIPIPESGHVLVYRGRKVGMVVAEQLLQFGHTPVGVGDRENVDKNFSYVSLNGQKIESALARAKVREADALIALARDELENLEVGLLVRSIAPNIKLVIRTHDSQFSKRLSVLWPKAHILSTASLAAEALAAAAFGENVPFLFRLGDQTILVTEYRVES